MNHQVDVFISKAPIWKEEMKQLRTVLLDCHLTEELKWAKPCYSFQEKNIVVIQPFKAYCALLFLKGYLLSDPAGILQKTGENTVVSRQIRFTDVKQVKELAAVLKTYIYQAVEVEEAGVKGPATKDMELKLVEEFEAKLKENPALKKAFSALTPGRQKAYNIYFSQPKQVKTREQRIEKYIPLILDGKGPNDDYLEAKKARD